MALLISQAGGLATTGDEDLMELVPTELHQRVPLLIGNKEMVNLYKETK